MRVGVRPEDAGGHELGAGEPLLQVGQERDGAALADEARRVPEALLRDAPSSVAAMPASSGGATQPWAAASMSMVMCAPSSVRMAEIRASVAACASTSGGRRSENLSVVDGRSTLPPSRGCGQPVGARHLQGGPPGAGDQPVDRVRREQAEPVDDGSGAVGELGRHRVEVGPVRPRGCPPPGARAGGCARSPRPRSERGCGAGSGTRTARRHRPAPLWMPSVSTSTLTRGDQVAPQRRGQPQPVVAEPARVEADHEARRPDALLEVLEVGRAGRGCRSPRWPR